MNDRASIVIVDDHVLFREAVAEVLKTGPEFQVIGQGETADDAVRLCADLHPDILLLDIGMPGDGLASARIVNTMVPNTKIVMLTASQAEDDMLEAMQAGACAYVLKGVSGRKLIDILREVQNGQCDIFPVQGK